MAAMRWRASAAVALDPFRPIGPIIVVDIIGDEGDCTEELFSYPSARLFLPASGKHAPDHGYGTGTANQTCKDGKAARLGYSNIVINKIWVNASPYSPNALRVNGIMYNH